MTSGEALQNQPPSGIDPESGYGPDLSQEVVDTTEGHEAAVESSEAILENRITEALEACEFENSPEVKEAISSYYEDHYTTGELISSLLEGDEHDESTIEELASSENTPFGIKRTRRLLIEAQQAMEQDPEDVEKKRALMIQLMGAANSIFVESSVGASTLGEAETEYISELHNRIGDYAAELGFEVVNNQESGENSISIKLDQDDPASTRVLYNRTGSAQEEFWNDVRHAGQLLYHGTPNLGKIYDSGALMSRSEQARRSGGDFMSNTTLDGAMGRDMQNSNVPHFSEYASFSYLRPTGDNPMTDEERHAAQAGMVAVPIGDVIENAPYARNAEFAVVDIKNSDEESDLLAAVPMEGQIMQTGEGGSDPVGQGRSLDRVFFSSDNERGTLSPDAYEVPIAGEDAPNRVTVFVYRDNGKPRYGSPNDSHVSFPTGQQLPEQRTFNREDRDAFTQKVNKLQQKYFEKPQFAGRMVIPLRRGVFEYRPENGSSYDYPGVGAPEYLRMEDKAA